MIVLLLAVAGGLGSVARFVVDGLIRSRWATPLPLATMFINVSGSLLLGFVAGLVIFRAFPPEVQAVLGTGFLGGYTTFSTASVETVQLLQRRRPLGALLSGVGTLVLACAATAAGLALAALTARI